MKRILPCLLLLFLAAGAVRATVPAERVHAREAFAERGFGIFVHWGVYAVWGKGEWYLSQSHMPLADYEAKAAEFNPTNFDARAWAKAFKGAGARYVTITSRHHDGFSMFDTAQTDYDIVDATPFGRDPLKELSQACAEEGLNLGFYYSLGRATFSVTIDNATDDADYAVYVCDTVDGDYVLDAAATQSGAGEFRTFTMVDDAATKFVKIVAAEPGYAFPEHFADLAF